MSYMIWTCKLDKATNKKEIKTRPVVVIGYNAGKWLCYEITSHNKENSKYHIPLLNNQTNGYADLNTPFIVDRKYFTNYWRDCTFDEELAINNKLKERNQWELAKQYRI